MYGPGSAMHRAVQLLRADLPAAERGRLDLEMRGSLVLYDWKMPTTARDGSTWILSGSWSGLLRLKASPPAGWRVPSRPAREGWLAGLKLCVHFSDGGGVLPVGDQIVGLRRLLQADPEVVYNAANPIHLPYAPGAWRRPDFMV